MLISRPRALAALLALGALTACSGGDPEPTTNPEPAQVEPKAQPETLTVEELSKDAENIALVPSPAEMQKALDAAGIQAKLGEKVPDRKLKMDVPNKDVVAVRTGVILADLLLTVKTAPKDKLSAQLMDIKTGMEQLGAGDDIGATIQDINDRVMNDAVSRDDLVKELDELSGAVIPEIEYEAGSRSVPLIQAGSWLGGANLVSSAIVESGNYDKSAALLRQPAVVDYFQGYVEAEGQDKAPSEVIAQLKTTLETLDGICKKEQFSEEDVKNIQSSTTAVLDLL
ncbi:MAG: hypothetical protein VX899_21905 [Myxococcota bacterium]|nr:hypothetical protein [Myxococcota bacterium]